MHIPHIHRLKKGHIDESPKHPSSLKLEKTGSKFLLINLLRSFLLMLVALGAVPALEAQSYVLKQVVIKGGGFVTGIVPHPNESGLMYCRTDVGGAYRWNPTNGSWIPLQDFLAPTNEEWGLYGVESIALDPQDTNRLYMTCGWLGVGRLNEVWTSTNRGANFTRVTAPFTMEANGGGRSNGERLAVDPNLGSILFNGTRRDGLWKSVNYGASWSKVTSFPVNTTANLVGLVFVEFVKNSGANGSATPEIWVGVSQGGDNLYMSTDGGASWLAVPHGAPSSYMPHRAAQDGLGNMYITFNDGPGPNDVGAGSVRKINLNTLASTNVTPPTGQGGFGGVSVDKQNPTTLVVSTMGRWWPHDEVYRSTNGGTTWTALYAGATIDASSAPWINFGNTTPPVPHWIGDIKIDPFNSNRVYHVSGGGIYSSYSLTATTPSWEFRSDGIEEMGLWGSGGGALCSPPSGALFFSALGDIGGFAHQNPDISPAKEDHYNPVYTSNTSVDFAEQTPNIVVRTHYGAARGSHSTDSGKTWTDFPTHPSAADNDPGVMAISADGQRLVWALAGVPARYSTNNGATWTQCGGNITPNNTWERPFLVSDRINSNKFYLYMPSTGVVHRSTDGGANFVAGPTLGTWCETMRAVYGLEGNVWISSVDNDSSKAGLWRSTDSGVSFTKISGVQNAQCIGFGRTASGSGHPVLYMGGQANNVWGIFRSEDLAASWIRLNDDQHQYAGISQITGDPKIYGRCYFGGRGLLYGDLPTVPQVTKMIYQDSLVDGWQNWSWATTNTASASPVRRGTSAISVTADAWAALSLHRQTVQSTAGYSAVAFWIHGGQSGGQPLQVVSLRNGNTQVFKPITPPLAGQWTRVVIPLSELGLANVWDFDGLWIQNASGSPISTFHVDDIALIGQADSGTSAPPAPGGLAATAGNTQVALTWSASSGVTDYNVKRATVSGGPYTTVTTVTGTSFTNTGLTNGTTYYYVVTALNGFGESGNSTQASATPSAPLPSPWVTADIGAVSATGSASLSDGTFTVTGSGADIWNSSDQFRYVYQSSSGECEIRAQVTSVQNTNSWAKAGVMIRESTAAGAISAAVFITPGNGVTFQWRTSTGGSTVHTAVTGVTAPRYVRLQRAANNSFRAYYSSNGTSWTQIGTNQTISMASNATIGLAVTSHNNGTLCTSTTTNITATP